ncbi:50S ribosomal protein L17 [Hibiscus syriacus]|uniref:50S ribosomal protein L17 n=1 Tax=Hibiscus syriacus TaxID=106335 RepID=A0A6A2ZHH7_HIBSY|nr:50S ribosomal protein L17 [Hibiscus syriacus]
MVNPRFSVKKYMNIMNTKCLAYVNNRSNSVMYEIEGSYSRRNCAVYDDKRRLVAEIKRKEAVGEVAFGTDVFRLIVRPEYIGTESAMALLILLDQIRKTPWKPLNYTSCVQKFTRSTKIRVVISDDVTKVTSIEESMGAYGLQL